MNETARPLVLAGGGPFPCLKGQATVTDEEKRTALEAALHDAQTWLSLDEYKTEGDLARDLLPALNRAGFDIVRVDPAETKPVCTDPIDMYAPHCANPHCHNYVSKA